MGRKKNHTDQAFKESLKHYQAVPPEGVWEGVTESLNADRKKVRMAWIGRIAAAAVIVIASGTALLWIQRSESNEIGRVDSVEKQELPRDEVQELPGETSQDARTSESGGSEDDVQVDRSPLKETGQKEALAADIQSNNRQGSLVPGSGIPVLEMPSAVSGTSGQQDLYSEEGKLSQAGLVFPGTRDFNPAGSELQAGNVIRSGPGEESRMGSISGFSIPVEIPGTGTLQTMYTGEKDPGSQGETASGEDSEIEDGIDVFEEFGEEGSPKYSKWAVGGQVTPLYSYRNLESSTYEYASAIAPSYSGYSQNSANAGSYNEFESGVLSYAGGVNVHYAPARRLSLQSGIYYSRMGMSITNSYVAMVDAQDQLPPETFSQQVTVANSTGQITQDTYKDNAVVSNLYPVGQKETDRVVDAGPISAPQIQEGDVLQQFEYIEVPLVARYRVVDRRLGLNLLGGMSTNFLVGNNVYFQEGSNKEQIGSTENIRPINYSSVVGLGLQYSLSKNLLINMEPTFRYYLNSVNTGSGPESHPYSLGFFTGISYLF